jgi:hypothetical protein
MSNTLQIDNGADATKKLDTTTPTLLTTHIPILIVSGESSDDWVLQ